MSAKRLLKHIISTVVPDKVYAHHFIRILYYGVFRWWRDSNALKLQYFTTPPTADSFRINWRFAPL